MTRKSSHDDEVDASCWCCCCYLGIHNPFEGWCDAIMDCIEACCEPVRSCIVGLCGAFAYFWWYVGWLVYHLAALGYIGVFILIVVYTYMCTKTSFKCEDESAGKCSAESKDPIADAWTPEFIVQLATTLGCVGCIVTTVYVTGICSGYFDQPFDKSTLHVENTLWMTCKHALKYFWVGFITATGFVLRPSGFDSSSYGDPMFMCYNDQIGGFLWGSITVQDMSQFGSFIFLVLTGFMILNFCLMSCKRSARCLCIECHCFTDGCYNVLCWCAMVPIWIGVPIAIVFQASAFFMNFLSPNNAVLALMATSDIGFCLMYVCAHAAPEGSRAREQYEKQKANQATGSGVETAPIVRKKVVPTPQITQRRPVRPSGGMRIGGGSIRPGRGPITRQFVRDGQGNQYRQTAQDDPEYRDTYEMDPSDLAGEVIDRYGENIVQRYDDMSVGYDGGDASGYGDADGGMSVNINIDEDAVKSGINAAGKLLKQMNKNGDEDQDQAEEDHEEDHGEEQDGADDGGAAEDAGAGIEDGGGWTGE